jgi:hypothetical protein
MSLSNLTIAVLLYADPGSGAFLLQLVMASIFGALFFIRRIKTVIFGLFAKRSPDRKAVDVAADGSQDQ